MTELPQGRAVGLLPPVADLTLLDGDTASTTTPTGAVATGTRAAIAVWSRARAGRPTAGALVPSARTDRAAA